MLRRVGLYVVVYLCALLGACGTPPKNTETPKIVSLTGLWRDTSFVLESCGVQGSFGLELDLVQTGSSVSGTARLEFSGDGTNETTPITGTIAGSAFAGATAYPIRNNFGEVTAYLLFDFALTYQDNILSGEMRSAEFTCADQTTGKMQSKLKLITVDATPVLPDALEPNNLPSQAKPIASGETLKDLTLSKGDVDWFKFTVTENSQATALLELLTEFPAVITVFDESELVDIYSNQAPSGELQAQANLLDLTVAMTPGNYYIAVTADPDEALTGNHDANGKYELGLSTRSVPLDENEFNNSPETATEIMLEYSAELSLYKGDRDWFKFTLTETREVILDITGSKEEFIYELYQADAETRILYAYQSAFLEQKATLGPGTYYVRVYNSFGDIPYFLKVFTSPLPDSAYEPNNSRETAKQISLDFNATIALSPGDEDWFTFTLAETQVVSFDVLQSGSYSVALSLGGTEYPFYGGQATTLLLGPGTYVLHFYGAYTPLTTTVNVTGKPIPDKALEPNDSQSTATTVTFPYQQEGVLQNADEDYFKFTLTSQQIVTLDLGKLYTYYSYELFAEGQTPTTFYYSDTPVQHPLNAGTYYLRLRSSGYSWQLYSLNLQSQDVPDKAYEANDSFNTARTLTLPFQQELYLTKSDEDWFKFTVTKEQVLSIGNAPQQNYASVSATLYNAQGQLLKQGSLQSLPFVYIVGPGSYYLKIVSDYSYTGSYTLSLASEDIPDTALESNDSSAEATHIQLGFDRTMLVNGSNDDWFTFTLSEPTQVSIAFRMLSQAGYYNTYAYLTKSDGTLQQSLYEVTEPILSAGTYYIQITSYETVKYRLSVVKK